MVNLRRTRFTECVHRSRDDMADQTIAVNFRFVQTPILFPVSTVYHMHPFVHYSLIDHALATVAIVVN